MKLKRFLPLALILLFQALPPSQGAGPDAPEIRTDPAFAAETFTFVRLQPEDHYRWDTDFPDADLNFSYRLQQTTSIKVNQHPITLRITDPEMFNYPYVYTVEPGYMHLTDEEAAILRRYLLNGGFYFLDDNWGVDEWENVRAQFKKIFPDREMVRLTMDHPLFHCVFDLKEVGQVPNYRFAIANRFTGVTWEREDAKRVEFWAIYDDKGRMMVLSDHNTDLGDSWEGEGADEWFFHEFSEKRGYPVSINIIFYMMTH